MCRTSTPMNGKENKLPLFSSTSEIVEDTWVEAHVADVQNEPLPRQDHAMVVLGPQLYIIGGLYGGRSLNDIQTYDLRTGEWKRHLVLPQEAMVPIAGHKCVMPVRPHVMLSSRPFVHVRVSSAVVALAATDEVMLRASCQHGTSNIKREPPAAIAASLRSSLDWITTRSRKNLNHRSGFGTYVGAGRCFVYEGKILIVGGAMKNSSEEKLHVLQLDGSTLTNLSLDGAISGAAPKARRNFSMALLDGKLYIFGGQSVKNDTVYDDLAILDLKHWEWADAWAVRGDAPGKRAGHAAWICAGSMYIIGGSSGDHEVCPVPVSSFAALLGSVLGSDAR